MRIILFIFCILLISNNTFANHHCIYDKDFKWSWRLLESNEIVLIFENISNNEINIKEVSFWSQKPQKELYKKKHNLIIEKSKSEAVRIKLKDIDKELIGLNKKQIQKKIIHAHICNLGNAEKSKKLLKKLLGKN